MTIPERRRLPLVDREVLLQLERQLDNPPAVKSFVLDFIQLWDERYLRLSTAVECRSDVSAMDAVLSIKTASSMVGAARLAQLASGLEDLIRAYEFDEVAAMLPRLNACASRTISELNLGYAANAD